uniref:Putative cuticular protein n=1 Tax=Ixodes ricinus TaxID=34613 RepID=A0A147BDV4_IXORI
MKVLALGLIALSVAYGQDEADDLRLKRQTYSLPRGSELLLEPLRTTFQCRHDGYFADIDNNCRVYHICTRSIETRQLQRFSFLCGNLTMFNQLTLTCTRPEDSVPCRNAPAFFYVNDNIGIQDQPFLYDDDVSNADQFIQTNKINTPGNVHVPTKRREGARSL